MSCRYRATMMDEVVRSEMGVLSFGICLLVAVAVLSTKEQRKGGWLLAAVVIILVIIADRKHWSPCPTKRLWFPLDPVMNSSGTRPQIASCCSLSHLYAQRPKEPGLRRSDHDRGHGEDRRTAHIGLGRSPHAPQDGIREHLLITEVSPDGRLVAERRIESPPLAVRPRPRQGPAVKPLTHARLAQVHRTLIKAQEYL